jgi:hypothetical protein
MKLLLFRVLKLSFAKTWYPPAFLILQVGPLPYTLESSRQINFSAPSIFRTE